MLVVYIQHDFPSQIPCLHIWSTYWTQLDISAFFSLNKSSSLSVNFLMQAATCDKPLLSAYVCAFLMNFLYCPAIGIPLFDEITIFFNTPSKKFLLNPFSLLAPLRFLDPLRPPFFLLLNFLVLQPPPPLLDLFAFVLQPPLLEFLAAVIVWKQCSHFLTILG